MVFDIIDDGEVNQADAREKLIASAGEYFGNDVEVEVNFVTYSEGKTKKQKDFESFVKEDDA